MAVQNGHFELAVALVEAGADPNDARMGFTPLHTMSWVRKPDASPLNPKNHRLAGSGQPRPLPRPSPGGDGGPPRRPGPGGW